MQVLGASTRTSTKPSAVACTPKIAQSRFAQPLLRSGTKRSLVAPVRAEPDNNQEQGRVSVVEPKNVGQNGATINEMPTGAELEKVLQDMSPEQQKQLAQLYMFMTQHPEARVDLGSLGNVRQAVTSTNNQVLLWRPAELLNGRMAMIGFVAALGNEALTGASLWQQLYFAPYAYFFAYFLVVVASQLNRAFGRPQQGIGPFTRYAEIVNGRAAMLGYVILAYVEYNQELRKAASIMYSRIQQQGSIGV